MPSSSSPSNNPFQPKRNIKNKKPVQRPGTKIIPKLVQIKTKIQTKLKPVPRSVIKVVPELMSVPKPISKEPKMSDLNIAEQFAQIGQLLKAQFEQAEKSKKEMDAIVASVKAEAQNKLENLDKTFFEKLKANEAAIVELKTALNNFSKRILPRLDKTEKELGLSEDHLPLPPAAANAKTTATEGKSKISEIETSLAKQGEEIQKLLGKLKMLAELYLKKE